MSQTPHEALQPYLSPLYWDGCILGGDTIEESTRDYTRAAAVAAKTIVRDYVERNRHPFPLESYSKNEAVDAAQWPVGTLLFARRELLIAPCGTDPNLEVTEEDLPLRPTDLEFNPTERSDFISVDNVIYVSEKSLLVVTRDHKEQHNLVPIDLDEIHYTRSGKVRVIAVPISLQRQFVVGQTSHTASKKYERFDRVNRLIKISEAQVEKKKATLGQRLAQLGLRPQLH